MTSRSTPALLLLSLVLSGVFVFAAFGQSGASGGLTAQEREILAHMRIDVVPDGQGSAVRVLRIEGLDVHVDGCLSFDCVGQRGLVEAGSGTGRPSAGRPSVPTGNAIQLPPPLAVEPGREYFVRYTLRYERGRWTPANYARGHLVPVNTRVRLESLGLDEFTLLLVDSGERVRVSNVREYSGGTARVLAEALLAGEITELGASKYADVIRGGELRLGMTKQEALLARGVPPKHKTASTDLNRWVYWSSRFAQEEILFRDGIIVEGAFAR